MRDIGCVIYTETAGGLKAEWLSRKGMHVSQGVGVGIWLSELKPKNQFEGEYEIIYTDTNGIKSAKLILIISRESGYYNLKWINNGKTTDVGIGIKNDNKLSVAYLEFNED